MRYNNFVSRAFNLPRPPLCYDVNTLVIFVSVAFGNIAETKLCRIKTQQIKLDMFNVYSLNVKPYLVFRNC